MAVSHVAVSHIAVSHVRNGHVGNGYVGNGHLGNGHVGGHEFFIALTVDVDINGIGNSRYSYVLHGPCCPTRWVIRPTWLCFFHEIFHMFKITWL